MAKIIGTPARRVLQAASLDTSLVPDDPVDSQPALNPQLAAFLATIEIAFHALSEQEWQVREDAGRALFRVEDKRRASRRPPRPA